MDQRLIFATVLAAAAAGAAILFAAYRSPDFLLYNHSPSMPIGFYQRADTSPRRGLIVTVRAAAVAPAEARRRGFNGPDDRFIKRVAAAAGDVVCARDGLVTINAAPAAQQRAADMSGRPLPHWEGCRRLGGDEYFLLGDTPDSFDGRYWGPVHRTQIEGVWTPLF